MSTYFYTVPVQIGEASFLLNALRSDLLIAHSEWSLYQDDFTGEVSVLIQTYRPLSLEERRKIVSCGLTIDLDRVE
jgi:hypothetical protein